MFSLPNSRCAQNLNSSIAAFRRLFYSSNSATDQTHFMVDYLIDSLGFSRNEAISASSKVTHLKSAQKPDLVVNVFRRYGFDDTHIKSIVCSMPEILLCKPDKTLEPKLALFKGLSLSGPRLVELVKKNPWVLKNSLDNRILPYVRYLRGLLGCDENVFKTLNRATWFFSSRDSLERLQHNVQLLRDCGLSDDKFLKFMPKYPRVFTLKPERLEEAIRRVGEELRIPHGSAMFLYGLHILCFISKPKLEIKFGIFRSFGWPDSDIYTVARTQPLCFAVSDSKLGNMLSLYMKEMYCTSTCLATCPALLMMSLEKRVKPRLKVLKILEGNELVNSKLSLSTHLFISESKFVEKCILRYKKEIPDLLEVYTNILKR